MFHGSTANGFVPLAELQPAYRGDMNAAAGDYLLHGAAEHGLSRVAEYREKSAHLLARQP